MLEKKFSTYQTSQKALFSLLNAKSASALHVRLFGLPFNTEVNGATMTLKFWMNLR